MNEAVYEILLEKARIVSGDDTSLRRETAQELLASIAYVMSRAPAALTDGNVYTQFAAGERAVEEDVRRAVALHAAAVGSMADLPVAPYRETPEQVSVFFKKYRWDIFANEIPCMLDYQLAVPVEGAQGVTYIIEYLTRFIMENAFLSRFDTGDIVRLLTAQMPDWRISILNIYEAVLWSAVARKLAGMEKLGTAVPDECLDRVLARGAEKGAIEGAVCELFAEGAQRDYALVSAGELGARLAQSSREGLRGLFPAG